MKVNWDEPIFSAYGWHWYATDNEERVVCQRGAVIVTQARWDFDDMLAELRRQGRLP